MPEVVPWRCAALEGNHMITTSGTVLRLARIQASIEAWRAASAMRQRYVLGPHRSYRLELQRAAMDHVAKVAMIDARTQKVVLTRDSCLNVPWLSVLTYLTVSSIVLFTPYRSVLVDAANGFVVAYLKAVGIFVACICSLFLVPLALRAGSRYARDRALAYTWSMFTSIYLLARQNEGRSVWVCPKRLGKLRGATRRRRDAYDAWRVDIGRSWAALQPTARRLARELRVSRPKVSDEKGDDFEARLLLWCAERPIERLDIAAGVVADLAAELSPDRDLPNSICPPSRIWMTGAGADWLPQVRRHQIRDLVAVLHGNPMVGGTILHR